MTYNPFSLSGKTILITGASSGIGRATAIECSRMGAKVYLTGRNPERLAETFAQLAGTGHTQGLADLTEEAQVEELADTLPQLDGVVHSAGITQLLPAAFIEKEDIDKIFRTNLLSVLFLNKHILDRKKNNRGCSFVFLSSTTAHFTSIGCTLYGASKSALAAAAKVLSKELSAKGNRVNVIAPAMVETPLIDVLSGEDHEKEKATYPLGYGQPEDVAWACVYLLSDAARWITGSELMLHGGRF